MLFTMQIITLSTLGKLGLVIRVILALVSNIIAVMNLLEDGICFHGLAFGKSPGRIL
jgi:hypothetical protein